MKMANLTKTTAVSLAAAMIVALSGVSLAGELNAAPAHKVMDEISAEIIRVDNTLDQALVVSDSARAAMISATMILNAELRMDVERKLGEDIQAVANAR